MGASLSPIPNFGIGRIDKFVLYIGATVFLASLFFAPVGIAPESLRHASLVVMGWSIFAWLARDTIKTYVDVRDEVTDDEAYRIWAGLIFLDVLVILVLLGQYLNLK